MSNCRSGSDWWFASLRRTRTSRKVSKWAPWGSYRDQRKTVHGRQWRFPGPRLRPLEFSCHRREPPMQRLLLRCRTSPGHRWWTPFESILQHTLPTNPIDEDFSPEKFVSAKVTFFTGTSLVPVSDRRPGYPETLTLTWTTAFVAHWLALCAFWRYFYLKRLKIIFPVNYIRFLSFYVYLKIKIDTIFINWSEIFIVLCCLPFVLILINALHLFTLS